MPFRRAANYFFQFSLQIFAAAAIVSFKHKIEDEATLKTIKTLKSKIEHLRTQNRILFMPSNWSIQNVGIVAANSRLITFYQQVIRNLQK